MESLLLGTLGYLGSNYSYDNNLNNNDLNNYYKSNLENNVNKIDKTQAETLQRNPEFYQQFDNLKFDNIGKPTALNEAFNKRSGFNYNLQRDIDFKNGYSNFQDQDMHYGVVKLEEFTTNNMVPFTNRRDINIDLNKNNSLKYEKHTGNNPFWQNKKEATNFFEPFKELTYTQGMPSFSGEIKDRYITSTKNNFGNLPFQSEVKVLPGIADQVAAPYPVIRINPRNIDELRSDVNQKVTYINKPLETLKLGELRAIDPVITKYKIPGYRDTEFTDLVQNSGPNSSGGTRVRSKGIVKTSQRGDQDRSYFKPGNNYNKGVVPNISNIKFSEPKKQNYMNDNTHAISGVNIRPTFTNVDSWTNYETDRATTTGDLRRSGINNNNGASYFVDRKSIAKHTLKQDTINKPLVSNVDSNFKNGYINNNDQAKHTLKQDTINKPLVSNVGSNFKNVYVNNNDQAKHTLKQDTINKPLVSNVESNFKNGYVNNNNQAKHTLKQDSINKPLVSNVDSNFKNGYINNNDQAKHTLKQDTLNKPLVSNIGSNFKNIYVNNNDQAKYTLKQDSINKPLVTNVESNFKNVYVNNNDPAKHTLKQDTINKPFVSNIDANTKNGYINNNDPAKKTLKQDTINKPLVTNIDANIKNGYINNNDPAKKTLKQDTINKPLVTNIDANTKNSYINNNNQAKKTIKQTTIIKMNNANIAPLHQNIFVNNLSLIHI